MERATPAFAEDFKTEAEANMCNVRGVRKCCSACTGVSALIANDVRVVHVYWSSCAIAAADRCLSGMRVADNNELHGVRGMARVWDGIKTVLGRLNLDVPDREFAESFPVGQEHEGGYWFNGLEGSDPQCTESVHCVAQELEQDFIIVRRMEEATVVHREGISEQSNSRGCSHKRAQAIANQHHTQKNTFTPKIQCWRDITYTDGSVMINKNGSPPLVGSNAYKPNKEGNHPSPQLQLYIKPNGRCPTNTINRAELAGILVALQQGHTNIATDSAS
eukprot:1161075-Pelagomonas_calceolata.AAC.24